MNTPLRRVAVAVLLLFGLLLANANYVQVVQAGPLKSNPSNGRILINEYERERGAIVVDGQEVAKSVPTDDALKYLRVYPDAQTYAHETGYYSFVYGAKEVEKAENDVLAGTDDRFVVNRLSDILNGRDVQGGSVVLTLNAAAQRAAVKGLGNHKGAVVAIEPSTGRILAMASSPSYDPNELAGHDSSAIKAAWQRLTSDPANPLLNRAIGQRYPPGSVFKLVTLAAALSQPGYNLDTEVPAPQQLQLPQSSSTLSNFGGESCSPTGRQSLIDALRISCNTAFAQLGLDLGADPLRKQAKAFGIGDTYEVPMTTAGSVFPDTLDKPQTALSAIGQYDVALTPLQAALVAAGIANNGVVMKPYMVQEIQTPDLQTLDRHQPEVLSKAVSPSVARELTTAMKAVVANGTGTSAQLSGVDVAGKTGTAQNAPGAAPHAWFVSFAPAENAKVAVAVIVENGGNLGNDATGGAVAAPIARAVMQAVLGGTQ